jgi:hypothetical protein
MDSNRSRAAMLIGVAAAAGAFGVAAMMSAATAPTARADDFTDVINSVELDYSDGQAALTAAYADFSSNDLAAGLASFFNGANDDSISAPESLLVGTVGVLTNTSVADPLNWGYEVPASFSAAVQEVELSFTTAEGYFSDASTALSSGEYGEAAYLSALGFDDAFVVPFQELLLGTAVSF